MSRYGGNTSCVEIRSGDQLLILDAGTGIRNLGEDPMYFPVGLERMSGLRDIAELASGNVRVGNFPVDVIALNHPGGCSGFRIEANGNAIGYLPNHEPYRTSNSGADARQTALIILCGIWTVDPRHPIHGNGILKTHYVGTRILARECGVRDGRQRSPTCFISSRSFARGRQIDQMVAAAKNLAGATRLIVLGASENKTIVIKSAHTPATELSAQNLFATA